MTGSSEFPNDMRKRVIVEIYRQAEDLGWDSLTPNQRTERYNSWLDDQLVGGVLTQFMSRERARVWMKDGPMKEFARAREGLGPCAPFAHRRTAGPASLVKQALGQDWDIVIDSLEEKPNRCVATRRVADEEEQVLMIWGSPNSLRDLVWAAIVAKTDGRPAPTIVVTVRQGQMLTEGDKERHRRLALQAGLPVRHVAQRLVRIVPDAGA